MNKLPYFSANLRRSLWIWPALLVGAPLGCGKSSDDSDGATTGGRGDAGSDSGDSGGSKTGGASPSTGATTSGGASDGGSGTGGEAVGGAGEAGGNLNDSGGNGSVGASGGASAGGSAGTGGSSGGEHLHDLGAACASPGVFGCSAPNELLVLICGADNTWQVRETCEGGERCDSRDGSGAGQCKAPVAGCETVTSDPICGETGIEVCNPGGFDTEVVETCEAGYGCVDAECVLVDDECPEGHVVECEETAECDLQLTQSCGSACRAGLGGGPFRTPATGPFCTMFNGLRDCPPELRLTPAFQLEALFLSSQPIKITVGPGWEIYPLDTRNERFPRACAGTPQTGCAMHRADDDGYVIANLLPLTDPPVVRNVRFEAVPEGTACDD